MDSKRIRRKRIKLWKEDPRCFWCGVVTVLLESKTAAECKKNRSNPLRATAEHLVSRAHNLRTIASGFTYNHIVIACNGCNSERGVRESKFANMRLKILAKGTKPDFCIL